MPFTGLLTRVRALPPLRLDAVAGLVVGLEMQVEVLLLDTQPGERLGIQLALLVLAAALMVRRRVPFTAFVVAQVVYVFVQTHGSEVTDHLVVPLFAVLFLNYSLAANVEGRRLWAGAVLGYAAGITGSLVDDYASSVVDDTLWLGLTYVVLPFVAGQLIRNRSQLQRALREKTRRLEAERAAEAERAVADERTRIAGELHDIVAHALSEMTIQASAAGRLAARDPDRARAAFASVESSGRDALGELRRLLGVLRKEDEELALAPQPSLRHVAALTRRAADAGLPVDLRVDGEPADLPPGLDVTGYRVVQEALGAALRERGAGRAEVVLRYLPNTVEVEVRDDGQAGDDVAPLGLRERVGLYGGDLQLLPLRDGGRIVRARLPVEAAA